MIFTVRNIIGLKFHSIKFDKLSKCILCERSYAVKAYSGGNNNKIYTNVKINQLCQILKCSPAQAKSLLSYNKSIINQTDELKELVSKLNEIGIKSKPLLKNIHLFQIPLDELAKRISLIEKWKFKNAKISLPLLSVRSENIESYTKIMGAKLSNKLMEFSHLMGCSEEEACHIFVKHKFLIQSKMSTISKKVNLLKEGGVNNEDIIKDLWILSYTISKIQEKLQIVKNMKLDPIKPWMLRCKDDVLNRTWITREENKAAMAPYKSSSAYLCQRLNMDESEITAFASKHPPVMRVQVSKLKEIIDFLFSEGFTETQICFTPRILCHSLNTIQTRLNLLKMIKYKPYSLSILCKSQTNFKEAVEKFTANQPKVRARLL